MPAKRRASSSAASLSIKRQKEQLSLEQAHRAERKIVQSLASKNQHPTDEKIQPSKVALPVDARSPERRRSEEIDWFVNVSTSQTPLRAEGLSQERDDSDLASERLLRPSTRKQAQPDQYVNDESIIEKCGQDSRRPNNAHSDTFSPLRSWQWLHTCFWYVAFGSLGSFAAVLVGFLIRLAARAFSAKQQPFCSSAGGGPSPCAPCPTEGLCSETGRLTQCHPGFTLTSTWGIFVGDKGPGHGICVLSWRAWLWSRAWPWLPPATAVVLLVAWVLRRGASLRAQDARVQRWVERSWEILHCSDIGEDLHDGGSVPLEWLKVKILRDEFGTSAAARQHEWLWDAKVLPELAGDPRLRVEPRVVKGEHMECVSVLSPVALRHSVGKNYTGAGASHSRSKAVDSLPNEDTPRNFSKGFFGVGTALSFRRHDPRWLDSDSDSPEVLRAPKWR